MKIYNTLFGKYVIAGVAAASLVLSPVAFAQDNKHDKGIGNFSKDKEMSTALTVHIENNGATLVRGAKVIAVSGGTITASTQWGNTNVNWSVVTDGNTQLLRKNGQKEAIADVKVGDTLSFSGSLNTSGSPFTVNAKVVKDWTAPDVAVTPERHVFEGKLTALTSSTLPSTLSLSIGSKIYSVFASAGTQVLNSLWATTTLSRFSVGDTVRVFGSLQSSNQNNIDAYVIRDASLR